MHGIEKALVRRPCPHSCKASLVGISARVITAIWLHPGQIRLWQIRQAATSRLAVNAPCRLARFLQTMLAATAKVHVLLKADLCLMRSVGGPPMSSGGMGRAAGAEQAPLLLGPMDTGAFDALPPDPGANPAALGLGGGFGMGGMLPHGGMPMGGLAGGARGQLGAPLGAPLGGPLGGMLGRQVGGGPGSEAPRIPFPGAQCLAAPLRCSALCACVDAPCPEI